VIRFRIHLQNRNEETFGNELAIEYEIKGGIKDAANIFRLSNWKDRVPFTEMKTSNKAGLGYWWKLDHTEREMPVESQCRGCSLVF
jgi:hypothetical protein